VNIAPAEKADGKACRCCNRKYIQAHDEGSVVIGETLESANMSPSGMLRPSIDSSRRPGKL